MSENIAELVRRVEALERIVLGNPQSTVKKESTKLQMLTEVLNLLSPLREALTDGDRFVLQITGKGGEFAAARGQYTTLREVAREEDDEGLARLCSAIGSAQRVRLLKELSLASYSSGELSELTGMAGGHLHHHIRELLSLGLLAKGEQAKYVATEKGRDVYLTMAALHRRLTYDNRAREMNDDSR